MENDHVHFTTQTDSCQHEIVPGMVHLNDHFLNKMRNITTQRKKTVCNLSKDRTYFFKENILYPYDNVEQKNNQLSLRTTDYTFFVIL